MDMELRPWTEADLALLLRDDTDEMNRYLGGPDGESIIRARHERFLRGQRDGTVWPFSVWVDGESEPVGAVCYWCTDYRDTPAFEAAWAIGTAYQGRGFATHAVRRMLEGATGSPDRRLVWAFPRTDNTGSNHVARDAGFHLVGEVDSEYPKGVPIRVNEWVYDTLAENP